MNDLTADDLFAGNRFYDKSFDFQSAAVRKTKEIQQDIKVSYLADLQLIEIEFAIYTRITWKPS